MRKYLVGLMCVLGVSALAQEKAISGADWQVSWTAFIRVIAPYYLNPKGPSDLRDRFEGTNVTWSGTVVRIDNTMAGKAFKIAMPPVTCPQVKSRLS